MRIGLFERIIALTALVSFGAFAGAGLLRADEAPSEAHASAEPVPAPDPAPAPDRSQAR